MRRTARIILFAVLLMGLGAFFWAARHRNTCIETTSLSNAPAASSQTGNAAIMPGLSISKIISDVAICFPPSTKSQFRDGLRNLNHVPIAYYGLVVDQDGNPLPQTSVRWSVAYNNGRMSGHRNGEITTDSTGRFSITGQNGKSLSVIPERAGYKFLATNGGGVYSHTWPAEKRYVPELNKPEVLTLWKLRGAEHLIRLDKLFLFPSNSNSIRMDMKTGEQVTEGGDLKITIQKNSGEATKSNPQDWSLSVEPLGGGIKEASLAEFRNALQAPAQGYVSRYESKMEARDPFWTDIRSVFAFVQARGGQVHSKLQLNAYLHAGSRGYGVQINALTNPNSSGNWEEDPTKIKRIEGR